MLFCCFFFLSAFFLSPSPLFSSLFCSLKHTSYVLWQVLRIMSLLISTLQADLPLCLIPSLNSGYVFAKIPSFACNCVFVSWKTLFSICISTVPRLQYFKLLSAFLCFTTLATADTFPQSQTYILAEYCLTPASSTDPLLHQLAIFMVTLSVLGEKIIASRKLLVSLQRCLFNGYATVQIQETKQTQWHMHSPKNNLGIYRTIKNTENMGNTGYTIGTAISSSIITAICHML